MGVSLVMFTQQGERREFTIEGANAVIGRTRQSDIQVPLPEISRHHCEIYFVEDKPRVRDLGSSNGTYVNNRRIQEVELEAGHTLTIGPVVFTVVINGRPGDVRPIKTVLPQKNGHAGNGKNGHGKKTFVEPDAPDESGVIDLGGTGDLMSLDEADDNPLAELEALSKQKVKGRR